VLELALGLIVLDRSFIGGRADETGRSIRPSDAGAGIRVGVGYDAFDFCSLDGPSNV